MILDRPELTEQENRELIEALRIPILKRYFKVLAQNIAVDIATVGIDNENPEIYIRTQKYANGQLSILETLNMAIEVAENASPTQ